MSTNFYFNNFPQGQITSEQLLIEDLVIESLQIYGMDVYYLPRTSRDTVDFLYGEDTLKQFRSAFPIEMYLENVTGMDGEGDFISKFGLEIRDEVTLLVSRRRFTATVSPLRPREGDIIYVPLVKNFFEITFVEHENDQSMFYSLGRGRGGNVYLYALKLKQFVFSEEIIKTNIKEIDDQIFDLYKKTELTLSNVGTGTYLKEEVVYQGNSYATANAQAVVYSWSPTNDKLTIIQSRGTFAAGANVVGNTSGAIYTLMTENTDTQVNDTLFEDQADNINIETESDSILDFSENNPFGEA